MAGGGGGGGGDLGLTAALTVTNDIKARWSQPRR
eukprot:SAG22_NODE_6351_length_866_cov_2.466754_1_plen_33_part_01